MSVKGCYGSTSIIRDQGLSLSIPCLCIEHGFISQSYCLKRAATSRSTGQTCCLPDLDIKLYIKFWSETMPMHCVLLLKSAFRLLQQHWVVVKETVGLQTKWVCSWPFIKLLQIMRYFTLFSKSLTVSVYFFFSFVFKIPFIYF